MVRWNRSIETRESSSRNGAYEGNRSAVKINHRKEVGFIASRATAVQRANVRAHYCWLAFRFQG